MPASHPKYQRLRF